MAVRFAHEGYGVLETNRVDRFNMESRCIADHADGFENGMIATVHKEKGTVDVADKGLKGLVLNSERIYDQFHAGLKNYHVENGTAMTVQFLKNGDIFTTNTFEYDTGSLANEDRIKSAVDTGLYGKVANGLISLVTAQDDECFVQAVKYTTVPDGQPALKFMVINANVLADAM